MHSNRDYIKVEKTVTKTLLTVVSYENPPPIPKRFVIFEWKTATLCGQIRIFCDLMQKDYYNPHSVCNNMHLFEEFWELKMRIFEEFATFAEKGRFSSGTTVFDDKSDND